MEFNEEVKQKIRKFAKNFWQQNANLYLVGGAVRDIILGREVKDWDFTTNLTPEEIASTFPKNSFYNNKFGTVGVVIDKDWVVEVTTFRSESGYEDSRHPGKVEWGKTIEEDLKRRDFTINALAWEITPTFELDTIEDKVVDPYNGKDDLSRKIVKTVGDADERFSEDALRMMRAVRIAGQLQFAIDSEALMAISRNAKLIKNISAERIRDELFKTLVSPSPADAIKLLKNTGLLQFIMPELLEGYEMKQKGHHIYDVWEHSLQALNNCDSADPVTRLATLLHDIGKPVTARGEGEARTFHNHEVVGARIATNIGKRLRLSKDQLDKLFKLVRWHMFTTDDIQTDKAVRRFIRNVTVAYLDDMIALRKADRIGSGAKPTSWRWELFKKRLVEVQKQPFSIKDLKVNGMDVMEVLGIKPGPKVGEILEELFAEVDENPALNDRKILLEKIEGYQKTSNK